MSDAFLCGDVASICLDLVATPSEYGEEKVLADAVESRLRELGLDVERIGNAVIAARGGAGDPVALVGHLDTVPNWPDGVAARESDRIVGRGAADMKGGVAVMLDLAATVTTPERRTVYVFYDREEGPNQDNGIHRVLAESRLLDPKPTFAVVLEPTGGTVHAGAVGTMNADIVFRGTTAHSARPWEGRNAIGPAVATALTRLSERAPIPIDVEGLRFHDVITVTGLQSGIARNVLPDEVRLWVNVRVAPGRSLDEARREVAELAGPSAEITWLDESPPAPPCTEEPAIAAFLARTGLAVHPKQAWTDVATLQAWGVPAINYGPGEASQAHQPGEWVAIERLRACATLLRDHLLLAAPEAP
jgi:succinyl-diaminopimelate desuccinylase